MTVGWEVIANLCVVAIRRSGGQAVWGKSTRLRSTMVLSAAGLFQILAIIIIILLEIMVRAISLFPFHFYFDISSWLACYVQKRLV